MIKLNLGCGHRIFPKEDGWINCDLANNWSDKKPDVECDIKKLPFDDNYADEVHAIHVVEHFYLFEITDVLKEWKRVLKPGGTLVIEVPDMNKILRWFMQSPVDPRMTWWALYGDPGYKNPDMVHKWCYTFDMLLSILNGVGFKNIKEESVKFHKPQRDMRIVGEKPKEGEENGYNK